MKLAGGTLAALALTLAACSSSGGAAMSATAAAQATGPAADAVLVCHHYMKLRTWVRGITQPTLADALKIETALSVYVIQSEGTGKLHTDLAAMYADGKAGRDIHAASMRVYKDCAHIGVTSG